MRDNPDDAAVIAQLRKGVVPYCALALMRSGPRYGYDLARALAQAGVVAGAGSVYPLLARLEDWGWIAATWRDGGPGGGPPRKYYALTAAGRAALAVFGERWQAFAGAVTDLLGPDAVPGGDGHGRDAPD